jgi:hypothetical protein
VVIAALAVGIAQAGLDQIKRETFSATAGKPARLIEDTKQNVSTLRRSWGLALFGPRRLRRPTTK